jgi:hypothetical protein
MRASRKGNRAVILGITCQRHPAAEACVYILDGLLRMVYLVVDDFPKDNKEIIRLDVGDRLPS